MPTMKQTLAALLAFALAAWINAGAVFAASPAHIAMILWRGETDVERGFREALAEQGISVQIEIFDLNRDMSRLPAVLNALRARPPDLVYTWGTGITRATVGPWDAKNTGDYLTGIPVLFTMVAAPWDTGIAPPPGRPARADVTGVSHIAPLAAQINAIRSYLPLRKLGIVFNPREANSVNNVEALREQARIQGFTLLEAPVPLGADGQPSALAIPRLVEDLATRGAQVLYIGPDNFIGNHRQTLTSTGIAKGIPCFTATELEIRDGDAMFGLISRYDMVGRLAATKARAILVNRQPAKEIPIETLDRFTYLIRLPIARRLKLYPPLPLLRYAEIIE